MADLYQFGSRLADRILSGTAANKASSKRTLGGYINSVKESEKITPETEKRIRAGNDWLVYNNQGATRNRPLAPEMVKALGSFVPDMGVKVAVFSGGQPTKAEGGPRVGSTRHDKGMSGDVFLYKDGRQLNWADPNDQPIYQEFVSKARSAGLTGFGAGPGYMRPGSMHIGFGTPGVWGAGGRGVNAPKWLRDAFSGAKPGQAVFPEDNTPRRQRGMPPVPGRMVTPSKALPQQSRVPTVAKRAALGFLLGGPVGALSQVAMGALSQPQQAPQGQPMFSPMGPSSEQAQFQASRYLPGSNLYQSALSPGEMFDTNSRLGLARRDAEMAALQGGNAQPSSGGFLSGLFR